MYNRVFHAYRKMFLLLILLVCAVLFWFFGCHDQKTLEKEDVWEETSSQTDGVCYKFKNDDVEGTLSVGLLSSMTKSHKTPVDLCLGKSTKTFAGTFIITLPGENGKGIAYQFAAAGEHGQDQTYHFEIPYLYNVSCYQVQILNQYNEVLLSKIILPGEENLARTDSDDGLTYDKVYIGVLTNKKGKSEDFAKTLKNIDSDEYVFKSLDYSLDSFPSDVNKLNGLTALIIDDFDTSTLSEEQKDCICEWVMKKGGCLYVGTGSEGKRVLSGIGEFIGVQSGEDAASTVTFKTDEIEDESVTLRLNALTFTDEKQWSASGWAVPEISYKRTIGKGTVRVFGYSLIDNDLGQWNYGKEVNKTIFMDLVDGLDSGEEDEVSLWYLKNALYSFMNSQTPNTFFYGIIFIVYLFCLGFFGYHLLRQSKKREYIWITIPMLSFSFFIFIVFHSKIGHSGDSSSYFSAVKIIDNINNQKTAYFLYQNAEGESRSVDLNPSVDEVTPIDYGYLEDQEESSSIKSISADITINDTLSGYDVDFSEAVSGHTRILKFDFSDSSENAPSKNFTSDIRYDAGRFTGVVNNRSSYEFEKLLVINGVNYEIFDDVESGESLEIDSMDFDSWTEYDEENGYFGEYEEDAEMSNILDYIKNTYLSCHESGDRVLLVGITKDETLSLFSDHTNLHNQISVVAEDVRLLDDDGYHKISDINLSCIKDNDEEAVLENGTILEKKAEVTYQFDPDKLAWELSRGNDDFTGTIYAYNYVSRKREKILSEPGDCLNCEKLENYMTTNNMMQLTYELPDGQDTEKAPVISMILKDLK